MLQEVPPGAVFGVSKESAAMTSEVSTAGLAAQLLHLDALCTPLADDAYTASIVAMRVERHEIPVPGYWLGNQSGFPSCAGRSEMIIQSGGHFLSVRRYDWNRN